MALFLNDTGILFHLPVSFLPCMGMENSRQLAESGAFAFPGSGAPAISTDASLRPQCQHHAVQYASTQYRSEWLA